MHNLTSPSDRSVGRGPDETSAGKCFLETVISTSPFLPKRKIDGIKPVHQLLNRGWRTVKVDPEIMKILKAQYGTNGPSGMSVPDEVESLAAMRELSHVFAKYQHEEMFVTRYFINEYGFLSCIVVIQPKRLDAVDREESPVTMKNYWSEEEPMFDITHEMIPPQ